MRSTASAPGSRATGGFVHLGLDAARAGERRRPLRPDHRCARRRARRPPGAPRRDRQRRRCAAGGRRPPARVPARRGRTRSWASDGHVPGGARRTRAARERIRTRRSAYAWTTTPRTAAFSRAWSNGGVVLVEGSDLLRADLYTEFLTDDQARVQKQAALHRTDELVGRMLADVDPARDAVFVVSPASPRRGSGLAVTGIRAPGVAPELLRSATSRRNGFVYVVDIAPTILQLLGYPTPTDMEGRAMKVVSGGVAHGDRIDFLVARQRGRGVPRLEGRDRQQHPRSRSRPCSRWRRSSPSGGSAGGAAVARFLALAVLGFLFATYVGGSTALRAHRQLGRRSSRSSSGSRSCSRSSCLLARGTAPLPPARARARRRPSCSTSATSSPAPGSSSTPCSATRRPSGSGSSGQGNITFSQLTAAVLLLAGSGGVAAPGPRHRVRGDRDARLHAPRDGRAALRRRLRCRDRGRARVRALRLVAARPHRSASGPS